MEKQETEINCNTCIRHELSLVVAHIKNYLFANELRACGC